MKQGARMAARRAAAAACVALAGCAADGGGAPPDGAGLFRTSSRVGGLAPAPSAGWYVPRQTPQYVKMGLAREGDARRQGWFARLFPARRTPYPAAVIAETAALPLPSVVQLENVATGAMTRVRIDERAPMGEDLVRLNSAAARELGVAPHAPLLVRVRFVAPAIAYRQGAPLIYASGRSQKAKTQLAETPKALPPASSGPQDAPIVTARLEGAPPARVTPAAAQGAPPTRVTAIGPPDVRAAAASVDGVKMLRVQAGAFANPGNARRAVSMLAPAGQARIQPVQRADGVTLYRVFLDCQGGAQAAEALRAKVVDIGFADARIVGVS